MLNNKFRVSLLFLTAIVAMLLLLPIIGFGKAQLQQQALSVYTDRASGKSIQYPALWTPTPVSSSLVVFWYNFLPIAGFGVQATTSSDPASAFEQWVGTATIGPPNVADAVIQGKQVAQFDYYYESVSGPGPNGETLTPTTQHVFGIGIVENGYFFAVTWGALTPPPSLPSYG